MTRVHRLSVVLTVSPGSAQGPEAGSVVTRDRVAMLRSGRGLMPIWTASEKLNRFPTTGSS